MEGASVPRLSSQSGEEIDFDGITLACVEYEEGPVGLTYVQFGSFARCFADVGRGGWPVTISSQSSFQKQFVSGICVCGGSAMGLEAACGIQSELFRRTGQIPSLNAAVIYSRNLNENRVFPDREMGVFAYNNRSKCLPASGQVGAGCSASKGQGVVYEELKDGVKVLCIVVNNAVGQVFVDGKAMTAASKDAPVPGRNTTVTIFVTNVILDNDALKQLACQVHCSMAISIRPFNTFMDGDAFYACSTGTKELPETLQSGPELIRLFCDFSDIVTKAIKKSVVP